LLSVAYSSPPNTTSPPLHVLSLGEVDFPDDNLQRSFSPSSNFLTHVTHVKKMNSFFAVMPGDYGRLRTVVSRFACLLTPLLEKFPSLFRSMKRYIRSDYSFLNSCFAHLFDSFDPPPIASSCGLSEVNRFPSLKPSLTFCIPLANVFWFLLGTLLSHTGLDVRAPLLTPAVRGLDVLFSRALHFPLPRYLQSEFVVVFSRDSFPPSPQRGELASRHEIPSGFLFF